MQTGQFGEVWSMENIVSTWTGLNCIIHLIVRTDSYSFIARGSLKKGEPRENPRGIDIIGNASISGRLEKRIQARPN